MRKDLKQSFGPARVAKKKEIYSALMVQKELKKGHKEELLAQERRGNIQLLRRNPKKLAQKVWGGNLSSTAPTVDATAAFAFFSSTFKASMPPALDLGCLKPPLTMDQSPPPSFSAKDVRQILRHTRNGSAPGLDGVPYSMLKAFPFCTLLITLHGFLFSILRAL